LSKDVQKNKTVMEAVPASYGAVTGFRAETRDLGTVTTGEVLKGLVNYGGTVA
jgi:hypothetical protein